MPGFAVRTSMFKRVLVYLILIVVGGAWEFAVIYRDSREAYESGDLSSFAWLGFLPFIIPLICLRPALIVSVAAVCLELYLAMKGEHR